MADVFNTVNIFFIIKWLNISFFLDTKTEKNTNTKITKKEEEDVTFLPQNFFRIEDFCLIIFFFSGLYFIVNLFIAFCQSMDTQINIKKYFLYLKLNFSFKQNIEQKQFLNFA